MAYNSTGLVVHDADAHIMEPPTWLRDHADPAVRDRIEPLRYPGGNELRQTGDPDEQLARPRRRLRAPRRPSPQRRVLERRGGGDHEPQELRGHRLVRRRGPAARARPARLRQPARVQHVPQPPPARLGARRRPRAGASARPAPTTGAWSSSAPSTRGCCRRCYVPLADLDRAGAMAAEAIEMGAAALLVASGCPPGPLPQPRRPRPGVGGGERGRHPGRVPRRRHRRPDRPATTSATGCRSRPTSTAARRTSAPSTTWASPARRRRRWRR